MQNACDITGVPRKSLLRLLAEHCADADEQQRLLLLCSRGGRDAYNAQVAAPRVSGLHTACCTRCCAYAHTVAYTTHSIHSRLIAYDVLSNQGHLLKLNHISNACHSLSGVAERLQHTCLRMQAQLRKLMTE